MVWMTHLGRRDAINVDDKANPTSSSLQGRVVEALSRRILPRFRHPAPATPTTHSLHILFQEGLLIHSIFGLSTEFHSGINTREIVQYHINIPEHSQPNDALICYDFRE